MVRRPRTFYRVAVELTKGVVVVVVTMLACGLGTTVSTQDVTAGTTVGAGSQRHVASTQQARVDTLMTRHDCSSTGFGPDVVPGSALVLRNEHVRHVSFDAGWAVYTGDAPGTLLALCKVPV